MKSWFLVLVLCRLLTGSVLEQLSVELVCWQLHVPDHRASDETVLYWQLGFVCHNEGLCVGSGFVWIGWWLLDVWRCLCVYMYIFVYVSVQRSVSLCIKLSQSTSSHQKCQFTPHNNPPKSSWSLIQNTISHHPTHHMGVLVRVGDRDVGQLDVQVLIHRMQCATDAVVVVGGGCILLFYDFIVCCFSIHNLVPLMHSMWISRYINIRSKCLYKCHSFPIKHWTNLKSFFNSTTTSLPTNDLKNE